MKRLMSIAASDSGMGAGIQAYLKAFLRCGVYGAAALERAHLEAPTGAKPGRPEYHASVERWTTSEFAGYISSLGGAADAAPRRTPEEERAESAFLAVARLGSDSSEIAFPGGGA